MNGLIVVNQLHKLWYVLKFNVLKDELLVGG